MASMASQPPQRQNSAPNNQESTSNQESEGLQESAVFVSRPTSSTHSRPPTDDQDLKKCWICFSDESEDGPETSAWRDPCPCALVAHEACLLDWIADMESPTTRRRTLGPPAISCPQCKSSIHLVRPRDPVVEVVRALERVAAKAVAPAAVTVALSAVVHASVVHGVYTITQIFGPRDAKRILQPLLADLWSSRQPMDQLRNILTHWRLRVGLPLITPLLILSRTTLADSILPVLPIVFFATQGDTSTQPLDFGTWPPSASMTMAVLPYVRSAYNLYYQRIWAEKEKQWLKAIQPRSGQQPDAQLAVDANAQPEAPDEENNFEIRIDGNIWDDWAGADEEEMVQLPAEQINAADADAAHPLNAPPLPDNAPLPPGPQNQRPQNQQQPQNREERLLSFSTNSLAQKILGALVFPTVASLSGETLKYILPASWTCVSDRWAPFGMREKARGLLQYKWGRSVVGGCLFVVVKDAVMLYVRYKMAQQHEKRHVLDYDRKTKRYR